MNIDIGVILSLLDAYCDRLVRLGVIDNQRCVNVWLQLHGDGSGQVMGEWASVNPRDDRDNAVLRSVMSLRSEPMFHFDTLNELHGELVALTMRTGAAK